MNDELDKSLEDTSDQAGVLGQEFEKLRDEFEKAAKSVNQFSNSFESELSRALKSVLFEGESLSDSFRNLAMNMADRTFAAATEPLVDGLSSWVGGALEGLLPFANGGVISGGVQAFANGGVVDSPTLFPMANGMGLMGEAGAEAIMPLKRGADGRLGVASQNSGQAINVTFHIQTPDVDGFQRSQTQIANQLRRVMAGTKN